DEQENGSEAGVELFANGHSNSPPRRAHGKERIGRTCRNKHLLLAGEVEFDDFRGFLRPWFEFPIFKRSFGRLNKQRAAADRVSALDVTVGLDNCLDF